MGKNEVTDSRLLESRESKESKRLDNLIKIQEASRKAVLALRAKDRLTQSEEFDEAYMKDPSDFKESFNLKELREWIGSRKSELENMSYRRLREIAKNESITLWSRLSKEELISEIQSLPSRRSS